MECRACGTTIADKAIVCFRCGAPTAGLSETPTGRSAARSWHALAVALVTAVLGLSADVALVEGIWPRVAWGAGVVAVAAAVFVWRRAARAPRRGLRVD